MITANLPPIVDSTTPAGAGDLSAQAGENPEFSSLMSRFHAESGGAEQDAAASDTPATPQEPPGEAKSDTEGEPTAASGLPSAAALTTDTVADTSPDLPMPTARAGTGIAVDSAAGTIPELVETGASTEADKLTTPAAAGDTGLAIATVVASDQAVSTAAGGAATNPAIAAGAANPAAGGALAGRTASAGGNRVRGEITPVVGGKDLPAGGKYSPAAAGRPALNADQLTTERQVAQQSTATNVDFSMALEGTQGARPGSAGTETAAATIRDLAGPLPGTQANGTPRGGATISGGGAEQFAMRSAPGESGWAEELNGRINWLHRNGLQRAEIQLHPAELGTLEISISTDKDLASVVFHSPNRAARELIEAELPRLREMFAQAGIELGQSDVSGESLAQNKANEQGDAHEQAWAGSADGDDSAAGETENVTDTDLSEPSGLIDYYI